MNPSQPNDQSAEPTGGDVAGFWHQRRDHDSRRLDGRRRGGQPGNQNARKFGFYSKSYQRREASDLDAANSHALMDEIALIRVFMRRVAILAKGSDDPYFNADILRVLCLAGTTLSRLIRAQIELSAVGEDDTDALLAALSKAFKELDPLEDHPHTIADPALDKSFQDLQARQNATVNPPRPSESAVNGQPSTANPLPTLQPEINSQQSTISNQQFTFSNQTSEARTQSPINDPSFVPLRFLSQNETPGPMDEATPTRSGLPELHHKPDEPPPM